MSTQSILHAERFGRLNLLLSPALGLDRIFQKREFYPLHASKAMRSYITAITILTIAVTHANAAKPRYLMGKWTGTKTERVASSIFREKVQLEGRKLPDGTIRLTERSFRFLKVPLSEYRYNFRPDGAYTETMFFRSASVSTNDVIVRGTWRVEGNLIILSGKSYGVSKGTGSIKISQRKFTYEWQDQVFDKIVLKGSR
ncbi:MAG: hypothetical protein EOP85_14215 [Verrucomicrobiaceae bacterium]|nr:MAG: hypothetical protein EOP85_14215 [Verrucomicrobiaceae bacterium]